MPHFAFGTVLAEKVTTLPGAADLVQCLREGMRLAQISSSIFTNCKLEVWL